MHSVHSVHCNLYMIVDSTKLRLGEGAYMLTIAHAH